VPAAATRPPAARVTSPPTAQKRRRLRATDGDRGDRALGVLDRDGGEVTAGDLVAGGDEDLPIPRAGPQVRALRQHLGEGPLGLPLERRVAGPQVLDSHVEDDRREFHGVPGFRGLAFRIPGTGCSRKCSPTPASRSVDACRCPRRFWPSECRAGFSRPPSGIYPGPIVRPSRRRYLCRCALYTSTCRCDEPGPGTAVR
jgi:hypothetical protein